VVYFTEAIQPNQLIKISKKHIFKDYLAFLKQTTKTVVYFTKAIKPNQPIKNIQKAHI